MPDFRLSDGEATKLSAFLLLQREGAAAISKDFQPRRLSAFSKAKVKSLLDQKLSCLGCHRLGDVGGRIGPDLSQVQARRRPEYVYSMIKDPRAMSPHSMMPRVPLPAGFVQLLANFLLQQDEPVRAGVYLSPLDNPLIPFEPARADATAKASARQIYLGNCAACHGSEGGGDGFNARFLPVKPTVHADPAYLSRRPDDTLYDGIHSGGYILSRSQMMPPWGETFSPAEISGLVAYLRTLCRCDGPAWSRDNGDAR
jgi:mono/diheme cytochrome c family protein